MMRFLSVPQRHAPARSTPPLLSRASNQSAAALPGPPDDALQNRMDNLRWRVV